MESEDSISEQLMKKLQMNDTEDRLDPQEYPLLGDENEVQQSKFIQNMLIKIEEETKDLYSPSKVLLIRNLPVDVTEKDVFTIAQNFGTIVNSYMLM